MRSFEGLGFEVFEEFERLHCFSVTALQRYSVTSGVITQGLKYFMCFVFSCYSYSECAKRHQDLAFGSDRLSGKTRVNPFFIYRLTCNQPFGKE